MYIRWDISNYQFTISSLTLNKPLKPGFFLPANLIIYHKFLVISDKLQLCKTIFKYLIFMYYPT